jgi:hypothetical protein
MIAAVLSWDVARAIFWIAAAVAIIVLIVLVELDQ